MDLLDGSDAGWRVAEIRDPDDRLLAELSALTRTAFAHGDLLPGLPVADGATDSGASIRADLDAGIRMWAAIWQGRPVGSVRVIAHSPGTWRYRRLAVDREHQGHGVAKRLIAAVEAAAAAEGVDEVLVWALVERGVPPFYSALGYRTINHFGSPDKPLSEVVMARRPDTCPAALAYPWGTEPTLPPARALVAWFAVPDGTVAVVAPGVPDGASAVVAAAGRVGREPARFLGADGWLGAPVAADPVPELGQRLSGHADRVAGGVFEFARPAAQLTAFAMPRRVHDDLLALCRMR